MAIRFGRDCLATARLGRILASGVRRDFRRGASFRIGHDRGLVRFARREVGPKLDHVAHDLAARHLALEFVGRKPLHFRCSGSIFLVFRSHRLGWDQSGRGRKRIRDRDRRLAVRRPQANVRPRAEYHGKGRKRTLELQLPGRRRVEGDPPGVPFHRVRRSHLVGVFRIQPGRDCDTRRRGCRPVAFAASACVPTTSASIGPMSTMWRAVGPRIGRRPLEVPTLRMAVTTGTSSRKRDT